MSSANDQQEIAEMNKTVLQVPDETSSWPKIFQVPPYLRNLNEKAYEPKLLSIGPYHRQKIHLIAMETHKRRFQRDLLRKRGDENAGRYEVAMRGMMQRARNCYSESLAIPDDEFVQMMVLDGCFIIELFCKLKMRHHWTDPILKVDQIFLTILRDLILVENQLPFFVLWEFLGIALEVPSFWIATVAEWFKAAVLPGSPKQKSEEKLRRRDPLTYDENSRENLQHLLDLSRMIWLQSENSMPECKEHDGSWDIIRSATKLREAGIKFQRAGEGRNLFDIKFENGTLSIPAVNFQDQTEVLFFNIIAFEQFDVSVFRKYFTEYITIMDFLIDTEKDVELLCQKEIMSHWLGTDEAAAKMFNRLGSEILIDSDVFFYAELCNDVNKHCNDPWNRRKASLMHNYFNTPWALISFFAAAFLLLLTLLQTIFAIFPRH